MAGMALATERLAAALPRLQALLAGDRAIALAGFAAAALAAWQAAQLAWAIAAPIGPVGAPAPLALAARAPADAAALVRFDPFFRAPVEAGGGALDLSQLGLALFAVRAGGPDGGAAILMIPGRGQRSISIGEEAAPGVTLQSVHADYVVLARGPATYQLAFPSVSSAGVPSEPEGSQPPPQGDATLRVATTVDPAALLSELALQARIESGEVTGYTLREGRQGQILQRLGLRPGDVLLEVNNHRLVDDDRVAELQEELMSRPEAVIRFERDGEVKTATVRIALP